MDWIVNACHTNPPVPDVDQVRMPGERGLALMKQQLRDGVALKPSIIAGLETLGQKYGITLPAALPSSS
jgi:LDH2 family malate/lactate/ureidoglycolate dehydrogenase